MGGKYNTYRQAEPEKQTRRPHPIWRGVGFALLLLTPIMGYFGAIVLVQENIRNRWVPIPSDLLVAGSDPLLLVKLIVAVVLMMVLIAIIQLFSFFIIRLFAPSRYGVYDVPPVSYRGKRKSR